MIEVSNKGDLDSQLLKSKRVLALFYTSWCPFCGSFLSVFKKNYLKQSVNAILLVKLDDYDNLLWDNFSIAAVPTVILFEEGKACRRLDGRLGYGLNERQFKDWLEKERFC